MTKEQMKKEIIQDLTPAQEAKLDEYYEKYLNIGISSGKTTKAEREKAEKHIAALYKQEGMKAPIFYWESGPLSGTKKCIELGDKKEGKDIQWSAGYGAHDSSWLGFYSFMRFELGLKEETEDLVPMIELASLIGWWYPYENICVITERPLETHVNANGDLHNFNGPSIAYGDGFEMYHFNGIEVPKELAEKPAGEISKEDFLGQENADIRREISNKIGIIKTRELLGAKVADSLKCKVGGAYELLLINYDNKNDRPYLGMKNPSIKADHIEGVRPGIKTVEDALSFRNGLKKWVAPAELS